MTVDTAEPRYGLIITDTGYAVRDTVTGDTVAHMSDHADGIVSLAHFNTAHDRSGADSLRTALDAEREKVAKLREAVQWAAEMVDEFSRLIATAHHADEELGQGRDAWAPVVATMFDGRMASYRDGFAAALKETE